MIATYFTKERKLTFKKVFIDPATMITIAI